MAYTRSNGPGGYGKSGGSRFGSRPSGGSAPWKKNFGGDRPSYGDRPTMHSATCSECQARCEVPFKPNGKKPIFCSNCFVKEGGDSEPRRFNDRPQRSSYNDRPSYGDRREVDERRIHDAVCEKCGKNCTVPFKPTGSKPVYCRDCFGGAMTETGNNRNTKGSDRSDDGLKAISAKLDLIMKALNIELPAPVQAPAPKKDPAADDISLDLI